MLTFTEYLQEQLSPGFKQLMFAGQERARVRRNIAAKRQANIFTQQQSTQIGRGFIKSLVGSSPTKNSPIGSGILGALSSYDRSRAERGVSFRRTPSMLTGLANAANIFAASDSRMVTDIGTGVRSAFNLKRAASEKVSSFRELLRPKPASVNPEPLSVSDELRIRLNTGQIPLQQFNPDLIKSEKPLEPASPQERADWLQQRTSSQPSAEERRQKYEAQIRARMQAIGDRPGFERTRSEFARITGQEQQTP